MQRRVWVVAVLLRAAISVRADEEAAVKVVEKRGGKVQRDNLAPGKPVIAVDLSDTKAADADLMELKELKQLRTLHLGGTKVTDAGLKELKELKELRWLSVAGTKVTDAGVADLKKALPDLKIER